MTSTPLSTDANTPAAVPPEAAPEPATENPEQSAASTATERGWDGWPTPPTPEYLIPGMGKVPVSSTVHFKTVAMTAMGDAITAEQLRKIRSSLLLGAERQPDRRWTLDNAGRVKVKTVAIQDAPAFEVDERELDRMINELRDNTESIVDWTNRWLQQASEDDRRAYDELLNEIRRTEQAAASNPSTPAQADLRKAQTALIMMMGRRLKERDHATATNENRLNEVRANLPRLFKPSVSSFADLVARLEDAEITEQDIEYPREEGDIPGLFSIQDVLNRLFDNIYDEGPLDPLQYAKPDAMESPAEGVLLHHEQGWFVRGLALGNLLHSVALAPGEVTQIAMTHWNHSTRATDSETVSQQDSTAETDMQDRAVSEIQNAAAREHTIGGSFGLSLGVAAQAGYAGFGITASGGMSSNVSTVVTTSDGSKNLAMEANQHVAAVTQRHAEAARTRRATVVREVSQNEAQDLTTRVLANYNHMHALTIMYFEVIEAFDLKTRVVDAERLIFLPYKVREVQELIPRFRAVLIDAANAAGKPELAHAIQHYQDDLEQLEDLNDRIRALDGLMLEATAESSIPDSSIGEIGRVKDQLDKKRKEIDALPDSFIKLREKIQSQIDTLSGQRASTMATFKDTPSFLGSTAAQAVQMEWQVLDTQLRQLRNQFDALTATEVRQLAQLNADKATFEQRLEALRGESKRLKEARQILVNLTNKDHKGPLHDNKLYFNQAVWLSLSPGEVLGLARRLYKFKGEVLCEHIDPAPVALTGNYVAYRWRFDDPVKSSDFRQQHIDPFIGDPDHELATVQTTIAVPTGGVFGEAVLGQAVSAEKIDLSRFWNWKDSMIPILPTSINPLTASTPTMQNLSAEPGKLDESSAKLGQLQELPAPSGFGALAETMRAQIFRDMSGQTLLQSLAEATTKAAASGSEKAGELAQQNYKEGLAFVKEMAPKVMEALAASDTGGASLMAGKLNAAEGGGTSLFGGMLNAKDKGDAGNLLDQLTGGGKGDPLKKLADGSMNVVKGKVTGETPALDLLELLDDQQVSGKAP